MYETEILGESILNYLTKLPYLNLMRIDSVMFSSPIVHRCIALQFRGHWIKQRIAPHCLHMSSIVIVLAMVVWQGVSAERSCFVAFALFGSGLATQDIALIVVNLIFASFFERLSPEIPSVLLGIQFHDWL